MIERHVAEGSCLIDSRGQEAVAVDVVVGNPRRGGVLARELPVEVSHGEDFLACVAPSVIDPLVICRIRVAPQELHFHWSSASSSRH
jgi:hypothetical protein